MNKISLVMATLGRVKEVEAFIKSLELQEFKNYELIIVDQNKHHLLKEIYKKYKEAMTIKYIRSNERGLSLNRNIGISHVEGNIIAFPDDDCEYDIDTLRNVDEYFSHTNNNIYTCKVIDKITGKQFGKSEDINSKISYNNVMKNCVSISLFIKFNELSDIKFDEKLGVGTYFGSGEESDLIFSLLHIGYKGKYYANKFIFHPARNNTILDVEKNNKDSLGLGALMKKEIVYRKNYKMTYFYISRLVRPFIGGIVYPKKFKFYKESIKYRIKGFFEYKIGKLEV